MSEPTKTIRVLQGHSICYQGEWYNQGAVLTVPRTTEFLTNRAKYDEKNKYLGDEVVSQVETIETPIPVAEAPAHEEA